MHTLYIQLLFTFEKKNPEVYGSTVLKAGPRLFKLPSINLKNLTLVSNSSSRFSRYDCGFP